MRAIQLLVIIIILANSGCATLYAQRSNVDKQVASWLEDNQYDKALATINALATDHPDYQKLIASIPKIESQREKYLQQTLATAAQYEKTLDWVQAGVVIDQGLEVLPGAPELLAQQDYYLQLRVERNKKDKAAILISKAQYLITSRPYQESLLYNSANKYSSHQDFNNYLRDAKLVSRELYALGYNYWQENKMVQAREALTLSVQTSPHESSADLLATILENEQKTRQLARQTQSNTEAEQLPDLESSFYDRLQFSDFVGAQKVLNEMTALKIKNIALFQETYKQRKQAKTAQLIDSGNNLYNAGYVGEAIIRWNQALELSPENQTVLQQLERANTFLENLERWQDDS